MIKLHFISQNLRNEKYMGESFQDKSWIQDFEADFLSQNAELRRF